MFIFVFYFACAIIPFVAVCMIIVGIIKIIKHSMEAKSVIEQGQDAMIEFLNNENKKKTSYKCEYCGAVVDDTKTTCPSCGAFIKKE